MAEKKRPAPAEGPHGVDRWSSNGYGITIGGVEVKPVETEEEETSGTDEIEEV